MILLRHPHSYVLLNIASHYAPNPDSLADLERLPVFLSIQQQIRYTCYLLSVGDIKPQSNNLIISLPNSNPLNIPPTTSLPSVSQLRSAALFQR
jgi:hypothetical protein